MRRVLTNWRAGCGKPARPVRREGWRATAIPTPITFRAFSPVRAQIDIGQAFNRRPLSVAPKQSGRVIPSETAESRSGGSRTNNEDLAVCKSN